MRTISEISEIKAHIQEWEESNLPEKHHAIHELECQLLRAITANIPLDCLEEICQAEKDGRLCVLPSKFVYEIVLDATPGCDLRCPDGECDACEQSKQYIYERKCRQDHIPQIGKTVFLTREAAEAALKEAPNE